MKSTLALVATILLLGCVGGQLPAPHDATLGSDIDIQDASVSEDSDVSDLPDAGASSATDTNPLHDMDTQ